MLCLRFTKRPGLLTCTVPMELGTDDRPLVLAVLHAHAFFVSLPISLSIAESKVSGPSPSLTPHPQTISGIQVSRQESRYTSRRVASDAPASAPERLDCRPTPVF